MKLTLLAMLVVVAVVAGSSCGSTHDDALKPPEVAESGGATTTFDATVDAFARSAANLDSAGRSAFAVGNSFFNDNWVVAPASADGRDGLGPTFNALSCSGCHLHDGRAQPPADGSDDPGLLVRLSVPGAGTHGEPLPEPTYGGQLGDRSIPGVPVEGRVVIERTTTTGRFADGTTYTLERPTYRIDGLLGPLDPNAMLSARVAPAVVGLGLLEAVPAADIVARADPEDRDGDGISGRPNQVWDKTSATTVLGRFGWKANQPTVRQQVADAFRGDIGITSSINPEQDCPDAQAACRGAADGGAPELSDDKLDRVTFYNRTLAVPARRGIKESQVRRGAKVFGDIGCASCHVPTMRTAASDISVLANQEIHPYTDLLLHDMGEGLADGRADFDATGSEWRTPPLWGIGLVKTVSGHTRFLHDGRARSLEEAILWHGGEGSSAQQRYIALPAADRAALLSFLDSL